MPVDNFARQPFTNDQVAGRHKVESGARIDIANQGEPTSKYLQETKRTLFKGNCVLDCEAQIRRTSVTWTATHRVSRLKKSRFDIQRLPAEDSAEVRLLGTVGSARGAAIPALIASLAA
ncbi:hypothetical protein FHT44_006370 [Mycolicibacterium sp. BK634]|uniref:hypothetical protein n=1 Tax=Mycolicibacterium sp. BK634 TaxID=2587099 RepID=UPI00162143DE|nr:hypothetical protein [Mycolicibacterium sp. BK634]MBB3753848.1 hypothetical protein [Mycolicibacterium sp. BK634]